MTLMLTLSANTQHPDLFCPQIVPINLYFKSGRFIFTVLAKHKERQGCFCHYMGMSIYTGYSWSQLALYFLAMTCKTQGFKQIFVYNTLPRSIIYPCSGKSVFTSKCSSYQRPPLAKQTKLHQGAHQHLNNMLQTYCGCIRSNSVSSADKHCSTCLHFEVSLCTAGPASSFSSDTPAVYLQRKFPKVKTYGTTTFALRIL